MSWFQNESGEWILISEMYRAVITECSLTSLYNATVFMAGEVVGQATAFFDPDQASDWCAQTIDADYDESMAAWNLLGV